MHADFQPAQLADVDVAAYRFARSKLRRPTKADLVAVAGALRGIPGDDFVEVATFFLTRTGMPSLKAHQIGEICGWFRAGYTTRQMQLGIKDAVEKAPGLGHRVSSPVYCTMNIKQLAESPAERELQLGRSQQ